MAGIIFKCSHCKHSIASDDSLCGEIALCPECEKEVIVPIPGVEEGSVFGDFKLMERLGSGASGEVWLAHQQSMDRKVALKILCPKLSSDKNFIKRFIKESKNSAKLAHPNIVTAFFAGQDKGIYYLAISYVHGETIESKLERDNVYDEKEALKIIKGVAGALQYAWDEFKILHRDIKPANIIINKKGTPMLLDLGISKSLNEEDYSLTMTGTVVGTPYYMSPEQAIADKELDFRSDIYSLGITLYHMLTGTVPYQASTAMAIIMKHINENFESPQIHNPKISNPCLNLIETMMAKKKEERQQSWDALIKDINLVLEGKNPETHPPVTGSTMQKDISKKGSKPEKTSGKSTTGDKRQGIAKIATIAATIVILGLIAGGTIIFSSKDPKSTANDSKETVPDVQNKEITEEKAKLPVTAPAVQQETKTAKTDQKPQPKPVAVKPATQPKPVEAKPTAQPVQVAAKPVNQPDPKAQPEKATKIEIVGPLPESTAVSNNPEQGSSFQEIADKLDYTKNTTIGVKKNWDEIDNKEFTWTGKVVNVKGGWFSSEVHVACDNRPLYRGFNAILVTSEKDKVANFKVGETVKFKGMVYSYKPKSDGLVIMYMSGVTFLGDFPETAAE